MTNVDVQVHATHSPSGWSLNYTAPRLRLPVQRNLLSGQASLLAPCIDQAGLPTGIAINRSSNALDAPLARGNRSAVVARVV